MRRLTAVSVVALVMVSLLMSLIPLPSIDHVGSSKVASSRAMSVLTFPSGLNTSSSVSDYPLIARGLMLPGGSTDVALADLNGDNLKDLIVGVYQANCVSVFCRKSDGSFPSYPSYNISVAGHPIAVMAADVLATGRPQIVVLERKANASDTDHVDILSYVSEGSYSKITKWIPQANATAIAIGDFNADNHSDIAVSCAGASPETVNGRIDMTYGPSFQSWNVLLGGGRGTNSMVAADFNSDGKTDLACANQYDSSVLVYYQPFTDMMAPSRNLSVVGRPASIAAGNLSSNDYKDLAVVTQSPNALRLFYQSKGSSGLPALPVVESWNCSLPSMPSRVVAGDMNGDGFDDILALSETSSFAYGFYQHPSNPIWSSLPDFSFPTQAGPQGALIGPLGPGKGVDLAVASARSDWSGSSIGVYFGRPTPAAPFYSFSNSNMTVPTSPNATATIAASGDINGDGVNDLVLLYPTLQRFDFMLSYDRSMCYHFDLGYAPGRMIVRDFNGDGYADILVTEPGTPDIRVYFGNRTPSAGFAVETIHCGGPVSDISFGKLDNDSMIDLVASTANGTIDIFHNTGNQTAPFSARTELVPTPGANIASVAVGDFNSDGRDDIAYSDGTVPYTIRILFQRSSNSTFRLPWDLSLSSSAQGKCDRIWSGDLDGDGKTDIAAMTSNSTSLTIFRQRDFMGHSTTPSQVITFPEIPSFVSVIDATDDGCADILASLPSSDLMFLYKQESGSLPSSPSMTFVTGALPNFAFMGDANGDHRPDLIVSDSASHCLSVWHLTNLPPVAHSNGPYTGTEGTPVKFVGSATTGVSELPYVQYRWSFGDGNKSNWSLSPTAYHAYQVSGIYNVLLEVKNPANMTATDNTTVTIADSVPSVNFAWSPVAPKEGQLVTFNDTSTSFDPVVRVNWTVDGRLASSGTNRTFAMRFDEGVHSVVLQLTDSDGSVNQTQRNITISVQAPTVAVSGPTVAHEGTTVNFAASVDLWHSGLGDTIVSYEWDFAYTPGAFVIQAYTNHTSYVFSTKNQSTVYTVACRATDDGGLQSLGFLNITICDVTRVTIQVTTPGSIYEFQTVNFTASVDSASTAVSYAWDFQVMSGVFVPNTNTTTGTASHRYMAAGYYPVAVRVALANGSSAMGYTNIYVLNLVPTGNASDIIVTRNPADTSNLSFSASVLAIRFPDIVRTQWNFGDGSSLDLFGPPSATVWHVYSPTQDYVLWLNVTDDEGSHLSINKTLKMVAPTIELRSPSDGAVVRSGTVIRFAIGDDSPPLVHVRYSVDGGPGLDFSVQWEVGTTSWSEGLHTLIVTACDRDGNIAISPTFNITIDNTAPRITVTTPSVDVFGGSKLNVTAKVDDSNLGGDGVLLYVMFPGDSSYQSFQMARAGGDVYYRVIEVPLRTGDLKFNVTAVDMAGNAASSSVVTVHVEVRFIDAAWPYMLLAALLFALGVSAYFMREADIAVDEAFVVHNDGRLISHSTRRLKPGMDDQILGGMFVAIQDFVKDSFKDVTSFTLRKIEFGEKSVLIEKGDNVFLAVILHRRASRKVASKMQRVVDEIEEKFGTHLAGWDGDMDKVRGVEEIVKKLYSRGPLMSWPVK